MEEIATEEKTKERVIEILGEKTVFVLSFRNFRDPEYFLPKEILEKEGIKTFVASNKKGMAIGAEGGEAKVDFLVEEVKPEKFDAIIFVGGPGCLEALDNEKSYQLIKKTVKRGKLLCAICISPLILAKAGVLKGKRATVWSSPLDQKPIEILKESGAIFEKENVLQDGKIITANGPEAAKEFGKKILENLK